MPDNFVIYVDSGGKMPILRRIGVPLGGPIYKSHRYWVEYRNNVPVSAKPYPGQLACWDYSKGKYVSVPSTSKEKG